MFVRNAWYIAASPADMEKGLVARTIAGEAIVLYRAESGAIAALQDRCPHRLVPLSIGQVVGDNLRCGYHGAEFQPDGACARIPGQKATPSSVRVRSFPVREQHGFIWVWTGDPALSSDETTLPDFWRSDADGWWGAYGHFESMKVDYRMMNDNLIDVTHAEFVHPESLGGEELHFFRNAKHSDEYLDRGMSYTIEKNAIKFRLTANNLGSEGGPIWLQMIAESRGMESFSGDVHFTIDVEWCPPSYCQFLLSVRPSAEPETEMVRICNMHAAIPETETSTNYYYRSVRNYGGEASIPVMKEIADFIFGQDKPVLEAQQRLVGPVDLFDHKTVSFGGDRLPMEARRILNRMIEAEGAAERVAA